MSEQVLVLGKGNKGINKTSSSSSVHAYESAWLGRWGHSNGDSKYTKELSSMARPEIAANDKIGEGFVDVIPFPMFKVSQKRDCITDSGVAHNRLGHSNFRAYPVLETISSCNDVVGSSSKAMANRIPLIQPKMYEQGDNGWYKFSSNDSFDFPVQEKRTQNLLELIRPMRIYATVDSVQGISAKINLPEDRQLFKDSTVSMKLKGKVFGGFLDLFPKPVNNHQGGVRLQSLGNSNDSEEGQRKNESSAETATLEMNKLQTIHLSGSISSPSPKGKRRKDDVAILRTEIPDMNEEPPIGMDIENSIDGHDGETSISVTQTMSIEHFLPNTSLTRDCKRARLEPESSSTWVKRLKTNASDYSGHETKSLMFEEASLSRKGNNNVFLDNLKCGSNNNLEPRNQKTIEPQIKNLIRGAEEITLLHPWIQRWCKNKATATDQQKGQVNFEPENQKNQVVEEIQKKQFPSIAAMALMGKALSALNPYGIRKTDSLMVWNSRDLR